MKRFFVTILPITICLTAIVYSLTTLLFSKQTPYQHSLAKPMQSIVRLHDKYGSESFFCSGVVISRTRIATAAHCIAHLMPGETIDVRLTAHQTLGISAVAIGANDRSDQALLEGDFSRFDPRDIIIDPGAIVKIMNDQSIKLIACGYPYAGQLFCSPFTDRSMAGFQFKGRGNLYPGMSGGPVIVEATGEVLAVNTAVSDEYIILSPLTEIFAGLGVTP